MPAIIITQARIKAALPFIPKHDIRVYLCGLHVTPGRTTARREFGRAIASRFFN